MLKLGTKAETLNRIYGKLSNAKVLEQVAFTVKQWKGNAQNLWDQVEEQLGKSLLIVRSSALDEDTSTSSQAGKFESVGNVLGYEAFCQAVNKVIASFRGGVDDDQILVQPMLQNVKYCGVAFTLDPSTLGNYYVINYDESGSTSAVTSGSGKEDKLLYIFKDGRSRKGNVETYIERLCMALGELEVLFGQNNLDVEFAITEQGELYIFQVRSLCLNGSSIDCGIQSQEIRRIEKIIECEQSPKPFLCGKKAIYGVMPDWNPAEMIGIRPRPLAMSLYREVITDSIWAYQRDNYGYRNLRSFPLMVDFCGMPYIDVRVSFNSFVPAELDEKISEKLVNYYIERLVEDPTKHDKIEFEVVFSCYTLDLPQRIQVLREYGFTQSEIEQIIDALRNLTNRIINHETGLWRKDYSKIEILEKRYEEIINSDMGDIEKIYWLLEDCKRYGTLPFAGLARAAFIAVQMLRSMVSCGIISEKDYQLFMNGVNTVSSNMNQDFLELSRQGFLKKYGHLRPGTYDITSLRYDEAPELYFEWTEKNGNMEQSSEEFRLSLEQMHGLSEALSQNDLNNNILELMSFMKQVIEGREYGKFIFTKNLSKAIQMMGALGIRYGISREDCSYLNIQAVRQMYMSAKDIETELMHSVQKGKEEYKITKSMILPPIILQPEDVWQFYYPNTEPNYITLNRTDGELVVVENNVDNVEIKNKILLIQSADPGYDWIFSHGIKGFITKYGGANSHMAIRAGELGIPAVIGVGEKRYNNYRKAAVIEINASARNIKILRIR